MLYVSGRLANARQEYDEFLAPDDDTLVQRQRTWRAAVGGEATSDHTRLTFDAARSDVRRGYAPSDDRYAGVSDFLALRATADVLEPVVQRQAFDRATLTAGVDATRNSADIASSFSVYEASDRLVGAYLQGLAGGDSWEASLTGRRDRHSREGQTGTWRAGGALFPIEQLRLHGSAATAFRAPSLFELYDPTYGNADLAAQRSRSYDLGVGTRVDREFTAVFCADLIPSLAHVPVPYVMGYDVRPLLTMDEKTHLLNRAVDENWLLLFDHDPTCEAATVERTEKGIRVREQGTLAELL